MRFVATVTQYANRHEQETQQYPCAGCSLSNIDSSTWWLRYQKYGLALIDNDGSHKLIVAEFHKQEYYLLGLVILHFQSYYHKGWLSVQILFSSSSREVIQTTSVTRHIGYRPLP